MEVRLYYKNFKRHVMFVLLIICKQPKRLWKTLEISETFVGLSDGDLQFTEIVEKRSEVVGKIVCHLVEFNTRREISSLRLSV